MVTYNLINLKKRIKYICCAALIFSCVLSFKVQATEDDIFSPASAKVYTAMSDDSDVAANLIVGSMFEVLGAENDANGTVWYQVRTDFGVDGYVKASELDRVLEQAQQMQQQAQPQVPTPDEGAEGDGNADDGNADDDNAGDVEDTGNADNNENSDSNSEEGSSLEGEGNVDGGSIGELVVLESVNLRKMPSTDSEILSRIDLNTTLSYYERYTNDAGEIWYRVQYEDMAGYVTDGAVMIMQQESQPNEEAQFSDEESENTREQTIQENDSKQGEIQSETEKSTSNHAGFVVDENPTRQKKHRRRGIDWMIIILVLGGALCVAAIVIFVKKILKLLRK